MGFAEGSLELFMVNFVVKLLLPFTGEQGHSSSPGMIVVRLFSRVIIIIRWNDRPHSDGHLVQVT